MLAVEAARDHGKSFVFSYAWPLFRAQSIQVGQDPIAIALVSYSEEQARKNLARIRKAIETKPELKWLLPKSKSSVWDAGMLNMSNEVTVEAFGFGSSVRGGHYHLIAVDDPTKDHFTMSMAEQENFLYGVLLPALRRDGQLTISGNPVEKHDLMERLEDNKEIPHFKYPAINEKGEALWPEQYDREALDARKRMMPVHVFSREYLLKRVSPADSKFKEDHIRYYKPDQIEGKSLYKVLTIDPAISPGGDALAAIATGTDAKDNTFVLGRYSHRGDFETGISQLCDFIQLHMPDVLGVETFAFQKMYRVWLLKALQAKGLNYAIKELGKDSKKTKAMRIESLQPKLAQGKLHFLREHGPLIDQILLWDPISKHNDDDEIDALAWQVGLWRTSMDEANAPAEGFKAGTMGEAIEELTMRELHGVAKLFEDLRRPS